MGVVFSIRRGEVKYASDFPQLMMIDVFAVSRFSLGIGRVAHSHYGTRRMRRNNLIGDLIAIN